MSELDFSSVQTQPMPIAPAAEPGRLRRAREASGLHIAVLANQLKVPVRKLEALEAGRFDELPDITFARALASSACRHLKIDPEPVLAELPGARPAVLVHMATDDKPAFRPAGQGLLSDLAWPALMRKPAAWLAAALLLVAAVVYVWPTSPQSSTASEPEGAPPAVIETLPLATADTDALESAASVEPVVTPEAQAQPTPDLASASGDSPALEVPAVDISGNDLLMIVGTGESWLEVVDAQGQVLLRRMLRPGEVHRFNTQPPYRVLLGKADAAQVRVRGRAFDLTPHTRNSVARFEVR